MPFSSEFGMNVTDPLTAYASGQPAAQAAERGFERGLSQADKARQLLKRNMAVEAMRIRAKELYSHMDQTPESENLAQRQAFLEYAPGIMGEERGLANVMGELLRSEEANLVRSAANKALQVRAEEALDLRRQVAEERAFSRENEQKIDILKELGREARAADREQRLKERSDWERNNKEQQRRLDEALETGRNIRAEADRTLKAKDQELRRQKALSSDFDLQRIDANLRDAQELLGKKRTEPWLHPWTDAKGLESSIKDLEKQRRDRLNELGVEAGSAKASESAPATAPKPAIPQSQLKIGAKYRLDDGRIGTYKGGDPEAESSYEFEPGGEG